MKNLQKILRRAAKTGDTEKVRALLDHTNADPSVQGAFGRTALMFAARHGHAACVELLIPVSDALTLDNKGCTALMLAAQGGAAACLKLLLPISAPTTRDNCGWNALMWAAHTGNLELTQLLLPVSGPLVCDNLGRTEAELIAQYLFPQVASLIHAYTNTMHELSALQASVPLGASRTSSALRI